MDARGVAEALASLSDAGVRVWLDGGWGVDALLGEQTRDHDDLDLIVAAGDVPPLTAALRAAEFHAQPGGTPTNFVLAHASQGRVDVHVVTFDERGYGTFSLPDGRTWPFPPSAFMGRGCVGSRSVDCLSAEAQVQCHAQGYAPTEKDLQDMQRLQARFGVVLPLALCRQSTKPSDNG